MKRLLVATCLSVAIGWGVTAVGQIVGIVDMREIFQASPQVKGINTQLEKEFSPQRTKIINLSKSLQDDVKKLQRNETVMAEKEKQDLKNRIAEKQKQLQQVQVEFQKALYTAQNKAMAEFMKKISIAVKAVAENEKVDLVVPKDTILYAKDSKDITSSVISKLQ